MEASAVAREIARRVARHLKPGDVINLGIGIPTLVADHVPEGVKVFLHTENGMVGAGPTPEPGRVDPELINAGKLPITEDVGAAYFSSSESFAMIRGGHVSVAVLGVLQVDRLGRIANWAIPGKAVLGVGGAMDLLVGARTVIVATTHLTKKGEPKIVEECSFPLTGARPADLIVTEHATFSVDGEGLVLEEVAPDSTFEWVRSNTPASFRTSAALEAGSTT
ncbi:3-oxoacid CoA-transferase, B subunit [Rubrobacter radiotolerans]|uniref:3-oxoacid CoA-transferase subunit B n=1 Tax=Rubrobacter radiotolerans TaxID=42256 RepID=A0A023X471_RUBRA|nr:3-oxoacid CoA-transferase subunit B [Rubrobacter radiotolerans]AHY46996.1 3-oxoacid CoA-transferase, B subunit [Rubrobacter radiotolerans]MDX5894402.1 3-oxoacid CoA-transferase subunit B [Rubrobacter radiotolerans]SMC05920.1 3-oxoacid CoA-transferase subunit B [Rubrobacter radiotolerans DSM 5868]